MYASAAVRSEEVQLVRTIELAGPSRFNESIRGYLPVVKAAVQSLTERRMPRATVESMASSAYTVEYGTGMR
eukprot:CAMPEP_0119413008 /NCGR_PEP_ID=MMETSP1335-20130426/5240_1 /TAXON_ID=259385 /ORGANISM="Chrysoculter rhomboideus, Strain RCC1486" /LENGTH=71 /DNA_ID=CAMNT_0007437777 /DNA_START=367 /DNA_END=579 /DNA_ORIENTATION=+